MEFINRHEEMERLDRTMRRGTAALVVLWGRRRLGKSRLLTEWCAKSRQGVYSVADESASGIQREYLSMELDRVFPRFSDVTYPDWTKLFDRISTEASRDKWRGPLILDEFPYLVRSCPELPSILQRWIDREKQSGSIVVALSGSSQRMMMSSVLNASSPLYGRADEILRLTPIPSTFLPQAFPGTDSQQALDCYTCWGGVPRYWELAQPFGTDVIPAVDDLVLSPLGALHEEVDRLLRQEIPSAAPLRPLLDAIGLGSNRISEIASRLSTVATSLTRNIKQLQDLGYVEREVPFGENEKSSKRALYKLADPFLRLWFRVVASHRGRLQSAPADQRRKLLKTQWPQLRATAWEELCRAMTTRLCINEKTWEPAKRYWHGADAEWDVVSTSTDRSHLLLGECKSQARPATEADIKSIIAELRSKSVPPIKRSDSMQKTYAIFVPVADIDTAALPSDVQVVDGSAIFAEQPK